MMKIPNDWGFLVYKKTENYSFSLNLGIRYKFDEKDLGIRYKFDEKDLGIPTFCCIINDSRDAPWRIPTIFLCKYEFTYPKTGRMARP